MNRQKRKIFFPAVLMLIFSSAVIAVAETYFNKGNELFKQGDYTSAVVQFKQAEKQGMKTVALHYNLASSYYKLEDYDNSKHYFKLVAQEADMRDLAQYNLGLIASKQGNTDEAEKYFTDLVKNCEDKKIVALSRSRLTDIDMAGDKWRAFLSANVGSDDNITALPNDAVLDISDSFYNLFVSVDTVLSGERKNGWLADMTYFSVDFSDTDIYDDSRVSIGLSKEAPLSEWSTKIHLVLTNHDFGGEDFQKSTKLGISGNMPVSRTGTFYLRYIYENFSSDNVIYDYLEGWQQRARIEYRNYTANNIKQLYYELELNNRGDLIGSTYAYEYSPTRHTVRGKYTSIFSDAWHLTGDLSYRVSNFPESADFNRIDDQAKFSLSVDYRFDKTFKLKTDVTFISNESTVDQYDYDKTLMTVGISKLF